eukprot:5522895-Prymnesium_polylepis.2
MEVSPATAHRTQRVATDPHPIVRPDRVIAVCDPRRHRGGSLSRAHGNYAMRVSRILTHGAESTVV